MAVKRRVHFHAFMQEVQAKHARGAKALAWMMPLSLSRMTLPAGLRLLCL